MRNVSFLPIRHATTNLVRPHDRLLLFSQDHRRRAIPAVESTIDYCAMSYSCDRFERLEDLPMIRLKRTSLWISPRS
jgi:hypothetical protein